MSAAPKAELSTLKPTASPALSGIETSALAAAAREKAKIEARYVIAISRPRDAVEVRRKVLEACDRLDFAEEARYAVPRGGGTITGLSARFAEEAARCIGNLMVDGAVSYEGIEQRIVKVETTDLESNVTFSEDVVVEKFVERKKIAAGQDVISSRMNSQNQRVYRVAATDDDLLMKQNSLVSKARRNGILRHLPADLQEEALERIEATIKGQVKTADKAAENWARLVRALGRLQVTPAAIVDYLGHPVEEMTAEEFADLVAAAQAIRDGQAAWEDVLHARLKATKRDRPTTAAQPETQSGGYTAEDAEDDKRLASQ